MTLNHAETVASLRDDPTILAASRGELEAEVIALLGDDDPLAVALVIEEAQRLGARPPPVPPRASGEGCRLEKDCGGREPVAGNGRCMTCGADRGGPDEMTAEQARQYSDTEELFDPTGEERAAHEAQVRSDTEAPQQPPTALDIGLARIATPKSQGPLTARVKAALGLTDGELAHLIGVSRPTAQQYVTGKLPEIVDGVRAEYLLRAVRKRGEAMRLVEAELQRIIAAGD